MPREIGLRGKYRSSVEKFISVTGIELVFNFQCVFLVVVIEMAVLMSSVCVHHEALVCPVRLL